jgi:hypothetical protein
MLVSAWRPRGWAVGLGMAWVLGAGLGHAQKPAPRVIYAESETMSDAEVVTTRPHSGQRCLRWRHGDSASISFRAAPGDWSASDTLTLWLRTDTPGGASFMMTIPSENPQSEGMDYYSAAISVQPGDWQRVSLNLREDLAANRSPLGWDRIGGLDFSSVGWNQTPNPQAVVYMDDIQLSSEGPTTGPRLTDQEFYGALNLGLPGLAAVEGAVDKGDYAAARTAFVRYLKARPVKWYFDWHARPKAPVAHPDTRGGDEAIARRFVVASVPYDFKGGDIDWTVNPTNPNNNEWIWEFSRHSFWYDLGRAYWDTGDEKYGREFVYQLLDWVHDCPAPAGRVNNGAGSRWRTIDCGIRMAGSWPEAFYRFLSSPSFTDEAIVTMAKSMIEHARYLQQHPTSMNWLTMESNGLYHVGAVFPEFKEAALWRDTAARRMYAELDNQVYPDGAQKELSTGYHQVSLSNFRGLLDTARVTGFALPADYLKRMERMWDYNMWVMMPDGTAPALNDSYYSNMRGTLAEGLKYFPGRADWQWLSTQGKAGRPPDGTSHAFTHAGQYVMRTGWGSDDLYCLLDGGPFGADHQHEDKLAFVISAYGSRLLVDTGSYTYDASDWRRYVLGATAHNTILVDGLDQARRNEPRDTYVVKEPLANPWYSTDQCDYVAAAYDEGFGDQKQRPATHRREVLFVKPDYWVVVDTLAPADDRAHTYTALFHLRPAAATVVDDRGTTLTDNGPGANLAIIPASLQPVQARVIKGQKQPFLLGWTLKSGLEMEPIPVATYGWQGTGEQRRVWVFYPLRPGDKVLPQVEATATGFGLRVGERTDEVVIGQKPRATVTRRTGDRIIATITIAPE